MHVLNVIKQTLYQHFTVIMLKDFLSVSKILLSKNDKNQISNAEQYTRIKLL